MQTISREKVLDLYEKILKKYVINRPVHFRIDDSVECPQIINKEDGAHITIPINQTMDSPENINELCNSIAHELSHASTYEKIDPEINKRIISEHYSREFIAQHILNEYIAYDCADSLYPQKHYRGCRSEKELQNMFVRGGRELYSYKVLGKVMTYNCMIDYFDNIFKCYFGNGRKFLNCAPGFAKRLDETIELLRCQHIETMTWDDFGKLYCQIIDTIFKDLTDQKQDFYEGIDALIDAFYE